MKLNFATYKDKVHACWIGKNIGGTMGTPYEGKRELLDVQGFSTEKGVVLANDDLDLQLVWLNAIERCGVKNVNAQVLGEHWLAYVNPHWNEYGLGKNNMKMGIMPPLSGDAFNDWRDSNGAWIRTEIWACLAPGAPDIAMAYAYEDACVDHGAGGEGTIATMFVAAMESAAFFEKDIQKLIQIGLSKIPEESRMAKSIQAVLSYYKEGMDYKTARNKIQALNADIGNGWFEAPSNVTYAVIGLLWGEGDFKKSMIYALNCGDDTDCTGGTVGALLGIIGGTAAIPEDWKEHIGDAIVTMSINRGVIWNVPITCSELTERVVKAAPVVLQENHAIVCLTDGETVIPADYYEQTLAQNRKARELCARPAYSFTVDFIHTSATVILPGDPKIAPMQTMKFKVRFNSNNEKLNGCGDARFLKLRWWLPEGFEIKGERCIWLSHFTTHIAGVAESEFELVVPEKIESVNRIVLEVVAEGKLSAGYIPIVLMG